MQHYCHLVLKAVLAASHSPYQSPFTAIKNSLTLQTVDVLMAAGYAVGLPQINSMGGMCDRLQRENMRQ